MFRKYKFDIKNMWQMQIEYDLLEKKDSKCY